MGGGWVDEREEVQSTQGFFLNVDLPFLCEVARVTMLSYESYIHRRWDAEHVFLEWSVKSLLLDLQE